MIYFIYIMCLLLYIGSFFTDVSVLGFGADTPIYTRLTYMFCHRSTIHFLGNLLGLYICGKVSGKLGMKYLAYLIVPVCFLATFGAERDMVTVGLSGAVYMYLGAFLCKTHTKEYILSLVLVVLTNMMLYLFANTNAELHGLAFIYGFIFNKLICYVKERKGKTAQSL